MNLSFPVSFTEISKRSPPDGPAPLVESVTIYDSQMMEREVVMWAFPPKCYTDIVFASSHTSLTLFLVISNW